MDAVVEKHTRSIAETVSRRRLVATVTFVVGVILTIVLAVVLKPNYLGTAHVLLVNDQQGRDPATEGIDMPSLATSTTVLDAVRRQLRIATPMEAFRKKITVKVAPKSSIMTITAKDHNPSMAMAIANALADSFAGFYASISGGRYQGVVDRLQADLTARRTHILSLENQLQQAASTSSYVGSQSSLDNTANGLNDLVTQRTMAYAQLVSDKAELESTRTQPGDLSKIIRHETLANDQTYHQLEINVSHDVAGLVIHKASYTDQYPGLPGEEAKVQSENESLRSAAQHALTSPAAYSPSLGGQIVAEQRAAAALSGDQARVKALDNQIAATKDELRNIPSSGVNVGAIRALRDAEEAQYQALSLRLSNAQANSAEANSLGSVSVIDRAEDAQPSLLGTNALLILGVFLALGLAIAAAYVAESLNPRFLAPYDIESVYGRPLLGSLNKE